MYLKRIFAALLAVLLLVGLLPTTFADSGTAKGSAEVWESISLYEDGILSLRAAASGNRAAYKATAADFAAMSKDVEKIVVASDSFKEGTISRHGDFFFWETKDGEPNGYSPRLRSQIREDAANATADPEALAGIETVSYSRGGSAGSVNVATFQPYYGLDSSFETTYATEGQRIAQAMGGTSTNYKTNAATVDAVATALETCGVVVFDSHGDTDYANGEDYVTKANSSYLCMQTNAGWTSADQQAVTGPYGTYYHCFNAGSSGSMKYYEVDGTVFANHMSGNGCNNLLWMAICLGMATDGLWKPLHAKGVEVVYGYSQSVSFSGDYDFEEHFFDHLIDGYTVGESFAYMKQKCGRDWDPAYSAASLAAARYNYIAFPNVVSSEDAYQGHRTKNPKSANDSSANNNNDPDYGACNIQTPKSTWTLESQFTVNAVSNNTAWGTVSVSGKTITASPKNGYYTAGYEVTEGTATVTQNGNTFQVKPESDCTVQINFEAKTPATIHFVTPDGVSCADINTYLGDEFTLPSPTGTPSADAHEYRFVGWSPAAVSDTVDRPAYEAAGKTFKATGDATYYALYAYSVSTGSSSSFVQLDADPGAWEGEYILTYKGETVLDASGNYTGSNLGSKDAAVSMSTAGMSVVNGQIDDPNDDYIYVIEASAVTAGAFTIRMKNSENYIAYIGNTNSVTTSTDSSAKNAQWYLSFLSGGTVSIQNANTVGTAQVRYLQYNTTSKQFRCYTNSMKNLTLFTGEAGTRYYTTQLASAVPHEHDYQAVVTAPTCTEQGYTTYTCSICGDSYVADYVDALGHDYASVVTEPTCTVKGYTTYTCSRCKDSYVGDETDALGHNMAVLEVVQPTCTAYGYTDYKCTRCDTYYLDDFVDALGHDWNEGVVTVAPTEEADGVMTYTCKRCSETRTEPIAKLDPSDPCAEGHTWGEWTVAAAPTCTQKGAETRTCSVCSATETRELEMLPHQFENGVCVVCGAEDPDYKPEEHPVTFVDVADEAYYAEPVAWAVAHGVTQGTGNGKFSPDAKCTRGQVVTFLWRAKGEPQSSLTENPFTDIKESDFFYTAVLWAVENNITTGTGGGKFSPNRSCTRGQVVTFLWRTENKPEPASSENPFTDVNFNDYYYTAVLWANENKITQGTGGGKFSPNASCTRGQIVTFLYRALA